MTNPYFANPADLVLNTPARPAPINALGDAIEAAFDLVPTPTVFGLTIKQVVTAGGTGDAITVDNAVDVTSYVLGQRIAFKASATNTGAATVNVDGLGVKAIKRQDGQDVIAGDIVSGRVYDLVYDGAAFQLSGVTSSEIAADAAAAAASASAASGSASAASTSASNASGYASAASASAASAASAAAGLQATSTTSIAIGTGSKGPFTTQAGKQFSVGAFVTLASAADPTNNWMFGQVTAYSGTSLTVNVIVVGGSGSHADWNIEVAGARGATGATGNTGPASVWTQIATSTPTGTGTVVMGTITTGYSDLLLVFTGLSHNDGGSPTITVSASGDNDSTRCAIYATGTVSASGTFYGGLLIPGYLKDAGAPSGGVANNSSDTTSGAVIGTLSAWRIAGGIDALRIAVGSGNFDAGSLTLFGR